MKSLMRFSQLLMING